MYLFCEPNSLAKVIIEKSTYIGLKIVKKCCWIINFGSTASQPSKSLYLRWKFGDASLSRCPTTLKIKTSIRNVDCRSLKFQCAALQPVNKNRFRFYQVSRIISNQNICSQSSWRPILALSLEWRFKCSNSWAKHILREHCPVHFTCNE